MREIPEQPCAWKKGNLFTGRNFPRRVLQAESPHLSWRRSEKDNPTILAGFGESGILTKESIAGMYCVGAGVGRCIEDRGLIQVAFGCGRGAEQHSRVGLCDVP